MTNATKLGALLLLWAQCATADSWAGPQVQTVFSQDGSRFVRVTPGESLGDTMGFAGAKKGEYAHGLFYERQTDRSYRLTADVALLNPIAPVDLLLSNSGYLITFDNWHNAGYGKVVAIYGPKGQSVASWSLEQLYSPEQISSISQSTSSRWWRCQPFHFVDPKEQTKVVVREALGGGFVFELATGKFSSYKGSVKCQTAGQPLSATFLP